MANNPDIPPDAVAALKAGRKIEAIKIVREHTGLGLKEAKDLVDAYNPDDASAGGSSGSAERDRRPREVKSGCMGLLAVGIGIAAALAGAAGAIVVAMT